jgi:archaemetzincin
MEKSKLKPKTKQKSKIIKPTTTVVKTYGPNNFQVVNKDKILKDMCLDPKKDSKLIKYLTHKTDEFYNEISIPEDGDWLWDHKETPQSFKTYTQGMLNKPDKYKNIVYIQNLDQNMEGSFLTLEMFEHIKTLMEIYYPSITCKLSEDKSNFESLKVESRQNYYYQYNAGKALEELPKIKPKDGLFIVGLTSFDIYPREGWNYVFGIASKTRGCGVFSFKRFYEELKGELKGNALESQITRLAGKIMLHEVGHLFGLPHCVYYSCKMNGCNNLKESLRTPFELCPMCLRKINFNLDFDIKERFVNLFKGLTSLNEELYSKEIEWYMRRIQSYDN